MRRSLLAPAVVGRISELGVLRAGLDEAAAGHGSTILLVGEAGVGKSRLLREVHDRCAERGRGRPRGAGGRHGHRDAAAAGHRGAARREPGGPVGADPDVAPFRAALGRIVPDFADGSAAGGPTSLLHIAEGFLRVARSRGRDGRGCAVLLDDLHWADAETLAVVEYLADNVRDEPVLVVATARTGPAGDCAALGAFADRRVATMLRLPRLTADQMIEMTRGCRGDTAVPGSVERLVADLADGLPFFVEELLVGMETDGALVRAGDRWVVHDHGRRRPPSTFLESVRHRVGLLPATAQQLL